MCAAQKSLNPRQEIRFFQLTLPEREHAPPAFLKRGDVSPVPLYVAIQLLCPVSIIRGWPCGVRAARMLMPEASMHEDCGASAGENYVRIAGQVFPVQPVTIARLMQESPDFNFRLRALRLDGAHHRATLFGVENVHYSGAKGDSFALAARRVAVHVGVRSCGRKFLKGCSRQPIQPRGRKRRPRSP